MNKKLLTSLYIFCDFVAAVITWICFFIYRKHNVDSDLFQHFNESIFGDYKFFIGLVIYPICWILLHAFVGFYYKINRKSRLKDLVTTISITLIGSLLFFFVFILDDIVNDYFDYIRYFFILFSLQFTLTYIPRLIISSKVINRIHRGIIGFNTVIIGSDKIAFDTYKSLIKQKNASGNLFIGYLLVPGEKENDDEDILADHLPCLGTLDQLTEVVEKHSVEEMIVAVQNGKRKLLEQIIMMIHGKDIVLKIIPQTQDFLMGHVKTSSAIYEPLITISPEYLSDWQRSLKRFFDILFSILAMVLLSPVYLFLAIKVKCSSKGPVFYTQERIGYKGKPFRIIKFRSMYVDSEKDVPLLSSKSDQRITPFGKFMRKSRLDETPQFFNVLLGDMSLVGPRPERQYFIDKIVEKAPYYKLLLNVKPGITSWGQVKYGYAENVDQMVERLKWDLLYLENMSLQMDLKILIYTALIVLKRTGK